tara:strand:+ start:1784 stop:2452 length:669 start_codon:yes stop_codon:yes gene_type:complete
MTHYSNSLNTTFRLYYIDGCPGARAVRLALRYFKYGFDEKKIDFSKKEHKTESFLRMNPMHTVPVLEILEESEGELSVWESRMILKYLNKSKKHDKFELDQWLFWDLGFLSPNVGKLIYPRLFRNEEPNKNDIPNLVEKFEYLNNSLENNKYLVNNTFSIADMSCFTLIQNSQYSKDLVDVDNYPNIVRWMNNVQSNFSEEDWKDVMSSFLESQTEFINKYK